ncbi:MAG: hypothetical protein ACRDRA_20395 [Pseudonocardiaceae bacterium]
MTPGGGTVQPNESPAESVPEAASPFPPAFSWEASGPEPTTQVMNAVGRDVAADNPAEATQVVPSYQQSPGEAGNLFQPVGTPHVQPTSAPGNSSTPPWFGSELPPIAEQPLAAQPIAEQQSVWLRQGPEVFPAPATQQRSTQIIGITVLGVVLLGLVGATVAYFLTTRPPDHTDLGQLRAPQSAAALRDPPPPLPAPVDTTRALIDPPGQIRGGGGLFDLSQLLGESANLLRPYSIVSALQAGGMTDGVLKTTTVGGTTIGMFALTMPDQQAATTVAQTIAAAQFEGGLKADEGRSLKGMTVLGSVPGSDSTVYRAVYVLYNRTIYVEVFGTNRDAVLTTFDSLIKQQVAHAPPTVQAGR